MQGTTSVDLVGLVLDRLTSLIATAFELLILALLVNSNRLMYHMIVESSVPFDAEM